MALRNILRAALAAGSGAASGYGAKQARLQRDEQLRQQTERQRQLDQLKLEGDLMDATERGWMTVPDAVSTQQGARSAIGSAIGSALSQASGGPALSIDRRGLEDASQGAATYNTNRRVRFGGQEMVLPETAEEQKRRLGTTERMTKEATVARERGELANISSRALAGGRKSAAAGELLARDPDAYQAAFPREYAPSSGFANLDFRRELEDEKRALRQREAEVWYNSEMPIAVARWVNDSFRALRKANPTAAPLDIIESIYDAYQSQAKTENVQARTVATRNRKPTRTPPGMRGPGDSTKAPAAAKPTAPAQNYDDLHAAFNQKR